MRPPWLDDFRSDLDAAFGGRPGIAALATADDGGVPRVRYVVVRWMETDGSILFPSDARSAKVGHLRSRPRASMALWLDELRLQYRLECTADVLESGEKWRTIWGELSDGARALFAWPPPGTPSAVDPDRYPTALPAEAPPPAPYVVLRLRPVVVERIDMKLHPPERLRWSDDAGTGRWREESVNP